MFLEKFPYRVKFYTKECCALMERVKGVVVAADALGHTFGGRVLKMDRPDGRKVLKFDGPSGRGLWTGLTAGRFLSLTALRAEGCGIALSGDEYKDLSSPLRPAPFRWNTKEGSLMGSICARMSPTWQFYAKLPTKEGACVTGSAIVS